MDETEQTDQTEQTDAEQTGAEQGPDLALETEHEIPLAEALQDPAGDGTELTHDHFDLGRSARIN